MVDTRRPRPRPKSKRKPPPSPKHCGFLYNQELLQTQGTLMHQHAHGGPQQPTPTAIPGVKSIIAVGSGKGGVGKTTLSVNLSLALARLGYKVGLLDADIYGPNVPLMLGATETPQVTDKERIVAPERFGVRTISVGLLNPGDKPLVWRGPMLHSVI